MSGCLKYRLVEIDTKKSKASMQDASTALIAIVKSKLENLKHITGACEFAFISDRLVICDVLGVVGNLEDILHDFGFVVDILSANSYMIGDEAIATLQLIKNRITFENVASDVFETSEKLRCRCLEATIKLTAYSSHKSLSTDMVLSDIVKAFESGEALKVKEGFNIHKRKTAANPDGVVKKTVTERRQTNNSKIYVDTMKQIKETFETALMKATSDLICGTTTVIKTKAEKMGYTVTSTASTNEVQLILRRMAG